MTSLGLAHVISDGALRSIEKLKQEKLYAKVERLPPNFQPEMLPVVAVAVSSVSVSWPRVRQSKGLMSAIFKNQSKRNSTPKSNAYLSISDGDALCCHSRVRRVLVLLPENAVVVLPENVNPENVR